MEASIHLLLGKQAAAGRAQGHRQGLGAQQAPAPLPRASSYSELSLCVVQTIAPSIPLETAGGLRPQKSHVKSHLPTVVMCSPRSPGVDLDAQASSSFMLSGFESTEFSLLSHHFQWGIRGQRYHRKGHSFPGIHPTLSALLPQDMRALGSKKLERAHYTLASLA